MKVAVITGAGRGIGAAAALRLARDGFGVAVCYNNSFDGAEKIVAEISSAGGSAKAYRMNIIDSAEVNAVIEQIEREIGEIAVLVNNAGIAEQALFTDITDEMWHRMIETNLSGAFYCSRAVLPFMIRRKSGKIINIASIWGETGGSCEVHYSAAKAGLIGMTKALAKEVGLSGITVNCVSPGVILTHMTAHFDSDTMNALKEETPLNRIGTPEDVAGAVAFLASPEADFITGQDIPVNGGMYI
ncbi:MAG: 3-oxoacyl-ACP reductase FabG [Oscillospiraceae bacterium]|nr:3-oxoacyl-ACP reductase FabG [Oscillospiraceae bacterium]